jgi:RNA polymerase sigma factor (sigma-70 family)
MSTAKRPITDAESQIAPGIIKAKVAKFLGASKRPREHWIDSEDLIEECIERLLRALPGFDPSRAGFTTFIARVAESALLDYARRSTAQMRNPDRPPVALDPATIDPPGPSEDGQRDLAIDLRVHIEALSPELQSLLEQLQHSSVPEIAKREGVHHSKVYRDVDKVRKQWETGSLKDYLDD